MKNKIVQSSVNDIEKWKSKAMLYQEEAKKAVEKALVENGFRPLSKIGEWKVDENGRQFVIFDYLIPNGHIEIKVFLTGWGQSCSHIEGSV